MGEALHPVSVGSVQRRADGIVHFVCAAGAQLNADNTRELFAAYREVGGEGRLLVLSDIRGLRSSTSESRALATTPEATSLHAAAAVIVGSSLTRMMGNLFMRMNKPAYPTRLFSDVAPAVAWLEGWRELERAEAS